MTCKQCFGDQTIWRRDANGKAIEVPCACVAMAPITDQDCGASVPPTASPEPVYVTAMTRPALDQLKVGDVVWMPLHFDGRASSSGNIGFTINNLRRFEASAILRPAEYDALPYYPMAAYPQPIHTSQRHPTEVDANETGRVLRWDEFDKRWYAIHWTNTVHYTTWWMPFPNPPPPPEQP